MKSNEEEEQDFTPEERERIISCAPKNVRALAAELGATTRGVASMRQYLQKERKKANGTGRHIKLAVKPQVNHLDEEANGVILVKFGKSSMVLNKSEVSMIELSTEAILIAK